MDEYIPCMVARSYCQAPKSFHEAWQNMFKDYDKPIKPSMFGRAIASLSLYCFRMHDGTIRECFPNATLENIVYPNIECKKPERSMHWSGEIVQKPQTMRTRSQTRATSREDSPVRKTGTADERDRAHGAGEIEDNLVVHQLGSKIPFNDDVWSRQSHDEQAKREALKEDLEKRGHICIEVLEVYPVIIRWCEQEPCTKLDPQ